MNTTWTKNCALLQLVVENHDTYNMFITQKVFFIL